MLRQIWNEIMNKDQTEEAVERKVKFFTEIYPVVMEKFGGDKFYTAEIHLL